MSSPPTPPVPFRYPKGRPVPDWMVNYDEIARSFQTGDLILQQGLAEISQVIQVVEGSFWSHVGMVVRPSDVGVTLPGDPWCYWESNDITTCNDVILGKPKVGPTLVDLKERLTTNQKNTWDYSLLVRHLEAERTQAMYAQLRAFIDKVHPMGFPDEQEGLGTWIQGRIGNVPNATQNLFCSECVAGSYIAMGVLTQRYVAAGYSPGDFTPAGALATIGRARLVDAIQIAPESLGQGPGAQTAIGRAGA